MKFSSSDIYIAINFKEFSVLRPLETEFLSSASSHPKVAFTLS